MSATPAENVCRDFLRNACFRGAACKYRHPNDEELAELTANADQIVKNVTKSSAEGGQASTVMKSEIKLEFCHDYQNPGGCKRSSCRFVHGTREEEEEYVTTGVLPAHLADGGPGPSVGEVPVCKDFMHGRCVRGKMCKYRHVTQAEFDFESRMQGVTVHQGNVVGSSSFSHMSGYSGEFPIEMGALGGAFTKRRRVGEEFVDYNHAPATAGTAIMYRTGNATNPAIAALEEENLNLRMRVRELEKKVNDVKAANEILLEQNAQLRTQGSTATPVAASMLAMPVSSALGPGLAARPQPAIASMGHGTMVSYPMGSH